MLEICKSKSLRLVAPENVMLRQNLIDSKKSEVLVNGEDAIAISATDLVDPPLQVRVARRPFRHPVLISVTGVTGSSSITAVLSGVGTVLLFFAEYVRDWWMKRVIDPLLKRLPWLKPKRKRPPHKHAGR